MSLLHQRRIPFATHKVPHEAMVPRIQLCFTCTNLKALQGCTSIVLECQGLASNLETKSSILQVICQLLRVQCGSLESLILEDGNLPFCPTCLKVISEIIILREKLFQIETEIREKLRKLESSVAKSYNAYRGYEKNTTEEDSAYDDFRIMFQGQVMEEHINKKLLHQKIIELNEDPNAFVTESVPSMVQFHLEKNIFSIVDRKPSLKVEAIDYVWQILRTDASTDTRDFEIPEEKVEVAGSAEFSLCSAEMPPVLEAEALDGYENFSLVPVDQELNISDDSDYGSPSKKSKTEKIVSGNTEPAKNEQPAKPVVPTRKKVNTKVEQKKLAKSRRRIFGAPKPLKIVKRPLLANNNRKRGTSKQQEMIDCEEEEEEEAEEEEEDDDEVEGNDADEGDPSDWIPKKKYGESDSSDSPSSDSDRDEADADDGDRDGAAKVQKEPEDSAVSTSEHCQKHQFKPKHSRHPPRKKYLIEPTFVKVVQEEETFKAKDKSIWTTKEPDQDRQTKDYEILREKGGLMGPAADTTLTPTQIFKLMFPPDIVETIVKYTNAYATHMLKMTPNKTKGADATTFNPLTVEEMYAYIGILLFLGAEKKRTSPIREVWTTDERYMIPVVAATMSIGRFCSITKFLRFDDKVARMTATDKRETEEEEEDSKFCYISEVFKPFVENMQNHLSPYDTLVVDEMLVKFRGSAKFRVYMKSKPGKYGIKFWAVCDVETGYILKIAVYEGKVGGVVEREHGKKVVLNMVQKYFGSGRGVTMDNFFTSKALGEELMKRNMSMLGTLNHNRMDAIPKLTDPKGREIMSSVFAFQGDFTMVSYVPKKNRAVLLLSTLHHSAEISSQHRSKPKMILDYNMSKGGVDTADQMIGAYTCQRTTMRWPMKVFQALLDIAAFNAYAVYKMHCGSTATPSTLRKAFLRNLSEGLMEPVIVARLERAPWKSLEYSRVLEKLGYALEEEEKETIESRVAKALAGKSVEVNKRMPNGKLKAGRCKFCPPKKRTIATITCDSCGKFVCSKTCLIRICPTPECAYVKGKVASARRNLQSAFSRK